MDYLLTHPDQLLSAIAHHTVLFMFCLLMIAGTIALLYGVHRTRQDPGGLQIVYGVSAILAAVLTMTVWIQSGLNVVLGGIGLLSALGIVARLLLEDAPRRRRRS